MRFTILEIFLAYSPISRANKKSPGSVPIYIGKAEAENARKGGSVDDVIGNDYKGTKTFFSRNET